MPHKRHNRTCRVCHIKQVYDPSIGSTWMETVEGFLPMRWCNECGLMDPPLSVDEDREDLYEFVSRDAKKYVARVTAERNDLDIDIVYGICYDFRSIEIKQEFVAEFTRALNFAFNISLTENQIKSYF